MTTITLHIGNPEAAGSGYPLRLLLHGDRGQKKEKAKALIPPGLKLQGQARDPTGFRAAFLTPQPGDPTADEMGAHLFELLSAGNVGRVWGDLRAKEPQTEPQLRVLLDIEPPPAADARMGAPDLRLLPWELALDGISRLAFNPDQTFLRSYKFNVPRAHTAPYTWPVRMLVVLASYRDDADVLAQEELQMIEDALRSANHTVDIEPLRQPTVDKLLRRYETFKPHIFHFIGHGGATAAGEPRLAFDLPPGDRPERGKETRESWTTQRILNELQAAQWVPRFAFINACRSGNVAGQQQAWTVGDAFRALGVPAVLTMTGDVKGTHAGALAATFYRNLADGRPLDVALARARAALSGIAGSGRSWAFPSLSVSIPPEEVLPLKPKAASPQRAIKIRKSFECLKNFVDRKDKRRQVLESFYPIPPAATPRNVVVVRGTEKVGKTWVAQWCMECCAWQEQEIRYVDVAGPEVKNWLDVLLLIRDGDKLKKNVSLIHEPLDPAAFHEFNWELSHRLKGSEPLTPWRGEIVPPPQKGDLSKVAENFAAKTLQSFCTALGRAAANSPLFIVLDHFRNNDYALPSTHMRDFLIPGVINQVAGGLVPGVKFVLVLSEKNEEFKEFCIASLLADYEDVEVTELTPAEAADVLTEYLRYSDLGIPPERLGEVVGGLAPLVQRPWKPDSLEEFYNWAKRIR